MPLVPLEVIQQAPMEISEHFDALRHDFAQGGPSDPSRTDRAQIIVVRRYTVFGDEQRQPRSSESCQNSLEAGRVNLPPDITVQALLLMMLPLCNARPRNLVSSPPADLTLQRDVVIDAG